MKNVTAAILFFISSIFSADVMAQTAKSNYKIDSVKTKHLFIDVHQLEPGKVKYTDVAEAHKKDLATQRKYGVSFIKYWVDESKGLVYCLSSSADSASIIKTHAEAHGLVPSYVYEVTEGEADTLKSNNTFFLDIHELGAGNVTAKDVAEAHKKDLAVQKKYGVSFINYWVDEKKGLVLCLSQAKDSASVVNTHREAHGLLPQAVLKVKQGQ